MVQSNASFRLRPTDFNKISQLGDAINAGWSKIPAYYYDLTQRQFPLTSTEFDAAYGGTIRVFDETQGIPGRQSNAETGSGVNEPFLALGAGIIAIGEGMAFTSNGVVVDRPAAAADCTPAADACVGVNAAGQRNGTLYWGGPGWNFIEALFQRFRLQLAVNRRFLLVDEALNDVGMVPLPAEFEGASSSLVPVMPYARSTNDVMAAKGIDKVFLPQNNSASACVPAPTARVTYGHPRITGLANRIYCFNRPVPIFPGMRFDVSLVPVENDVSLLAAMKRESILDDTTPTTPDGLFPEAVCDTEGNTLQVYASTYDIPGGTVSIGVVLKGFALQPSACVDYVANLVPGTAAWDMMAGTPALGQLIQQAQFMNLAAGPDVMEKMQKLAQAPKV